MLIFLSDLFGDNLVSFSGALMIGGIFGALAQHSRFCLRSATLEFGSFQPGAKMAVWLLTFSGAIIGVSLALISGVLDISEARQIAATGSMSGAVLGGLIFGVGMILARGCASRLLVLSATGNLRALTTGLLLTVVAQASLRGGLSPLRQYLSQLWTVSPGDARNLLSYAGAGPGTGLVIGMVIFVLAVGLAFRGDLRPSRLFAGAGVGGAVALGWIFTYQMSRVSFEPLQPQSISFTGPSADTLMGLINVPNLPLQFSIGLVPGVFAGSFLAALASRELKLQGFHDGHSMLRYGAGAIFMGFGGMLAGGCAVGAGVTGGAIFAVTAWLALFCMWLGALATRAIMLRVSPQSL